MKLYLDQIDGMLHEEIAKAAYHMAKTYDDAELLALAFELQDAVDNERESQGIVNRIKTYLSEERNTE